MFLVAAAMVSAWLITVADIPAQMIALLKPFMGNQTLLLIAIMVLVMAVGTAMDMTPTILIMTPVLMPVVKAAGIDPVYFGVLFIINNAIGLVTPPVGTVLNVVAGVGRMKMDEVTRASCRSCAPSSPSCSSWCSSRSWSPCRPSGSPADARPATSPTQPQRRQPMKRSTLLQSLVIATALVLAGARTGARQDLQARAAEPQGPPAGGGCEQVRRTGGHQDRRQDQGQRVPRRHAGRRCAQRVGRAGRHARIRAAELGHPGLAGEGLRGLRLPVHVRQRQGGRHGGRRRLRPEAARQAGRKRPGRVWRTSSWAFATSPTASGPSTRWTTSPA